MDHAVFISRGINTKLIATRTLEQPVILKSTPGGVEEATTTYPYELIEMNDVLYRLSHATVYINYDGYAIYSMTFKPKAKVGLMTAGWTSCFHDGMPLAFFC